MNRSIIFYEARQSLDTARNEYARINALSLVGAFAAVHACYLAVGNLYSVATGFKLPQNRYVSYPVLHRIVSMLGILNEYQEPSRQFIEKLTDSELDEIMGVGSQAYRYYKKIKSGLIARELMDGAQRFISETEHLAGSEKVMAQIRMHSPVNTLWQASSRIGQTCHQVAEA